MLMLSGLSLPEEELALRWLKLSEPSDLPDDGMARRYDMTMIMMITTVPCIVRRPRLGSASESDSESQELEHMLKQGSSTATMRNAWGGDSFYK